jgi:hypothetical protein
MPIFMLIAFAVFGVCAIAQFWFMKRVRDALIERHPQTFLELEKSAFFPYQRLWRFTRGRRYKDLGDAELNMHVRNLKRLWIIGFAAWLAYGIGILTTFH